MDVAAQLAALVATGTPPLDRALALIAAAGRPEVDPERVVRRLDSLAEDVPAADPVTLCAALFGPLGFRGNREDYYDPDNSLLDRVLDRRIGIPITLAVVAMEVGRRRAIPLLGVGMPGHFLLRSAGDPDLFLDAFDGGRPLDAAGCRRLFVGLHGASAPFDPAYLAPSSPQEIVTRVLNNLRAARLRRSDRAGLLEVLRMQAALPDAGLAEQRQLAGVLAAEGRFVEAAALHERLAGTDPDRADDHVAAVMRLRANLN